MNASRLARQAPRRPKMELIFGRTLRGYLVLSRIGTDAAIPLMTWACARRPELQYRRRDTAYPSEAKEFF